VVHANATLTPKGRLLLARRIVDEGWPIVRAVEHFTVSWPTAKRWAVRYAEMGEAGVVD
jgi:transposase